MKVEREIQIDAPPERVYEVIADLSRLGEWVTIHQALLESPSGPLRKGSKLVQCLKLAGRQFKVRWTVVDNDPPRRLAWNGQGPVRSKARAVSLLTPRAGGTLFSYTNEFDLPGGPLGRMAGPVVSRVTGGELERSLARLKKLVE